MRNIISFAGFTVIVFSAAAQQKAVSASKDVLTMTATKASTLIKIDGRLNEADWNQVIAVDKFVQVDPHEGEAPIYKTTVRILFDEKNIYVGAVCYDPMGKKGVRVQDLKRDFEYFSNDLFGISLDPFFTKRNATAFQTNPYGAQRDLQVFDNYIYDREWDALWNVRSNITDSGWVCEMAIPWKTIRYPRPGKDETVWGINLNRIARRDNEISAYPGFPRSVTTYRMDYAVPLKGLQPPPPATNIQVNPYVITEYKSNNQTPHHRPHFKLGGEMKWNPNVHSTLDLTVNTDFAQADADRQVNNLTRFSVFFPERRQFFLENAGLFDAGDEYTYKPFFSRTIGLDDDGAPIPLDGGIRFTDKNAKYSLGALYVHQRGTRTQPGANMSMARYIRNYGGQNNIGFLITNRVDERTDSTVAGVNNGFNITGFNRINKKLSVNYVVSATNSSGLSRDNGIAFFTKLLYESNNIVYGWTPSYVSKSFNPKMGFLARTDFLKNFFQVYLIKRKQKWFPASVRSWEPGLYADIYQTPGNFKLQEATFGIYPFMFFTNSGALYQIKYELNHQNLITTFSPLGIPIAAGKYTYHQLIANYNSDASRKISYTLQYSGGGYYNGKINSISTSLRYAPTPHASFSVAYDYNKIKKLGINKSNVETHLITPNIRLALNPRLQMNLFYQYNTLTSQSRWNARFSWEYKPLSYIYLVWNENKMPNLKEDQAIAKITFLKQF